MSFVRINIDDSLVFFLVSRLVILRIDGIFYIIVNVVRIFVCVKICCWLNGYKIVNRCFMFIKVRFIREVL